MRNNNNSWTAALVLVLSMCYSSTARGGELFDYHVVATGTLNTNSHIDGTTFVNNLTVSNQPNFAVQPAAGSGDTLDVTGTVSGSGLTLSQGVFRHVSDLPNGFTLNLNSGSQQVTDPTLGITDLVNQMTSAGSFFSSLTATSVTAANGNISLSSVGSGLSVRSVSASDLSLQNETISMNAASGSTLLIVVSDSSFSFGSSEHMNLTGSAEQIMWYFPNATTINLGDSTWIGSILAPNATLTNNNQNINGGVYVNNFIQTAEVHLSDPSLATGAPMFAGPVAAVPSPSIVLSVFAGAMLIGVKELVRLRGGLYSLARLADSMIFGQILNKFHRLVMRRQV